MAEFKIPFNNKSLSNLIKNKTTILILGAVIVASIFLISYGTQTETFAQNNVIESDTVNDVSIKTIFHFRAGDEEIDSFKVFTQTSGFIRSKSPVFALQGIVSNDRPLLYEAVDRTFDEPNTRHEFSQFEVDVYIHNGESVYRHFSYTDCNVQNYWVDTEFDKEETYNGKTKFAVVDKFEFICSGYDLLNPVYEKMLQDKTDAKVKAIQELTAQKK